jgi:hypothetical protein
LIRLDAATVLLQWAAGGLLFLWVTTRRRQVGVGYGWLLRGVYLALAALALGAGARWRPDGPRDLLAAFTIVAIAVALAVSVDRRKVGLRGRRAFPPVLDGIAAAVGMAGVVAGGIAAGGPHALAVVRALAGAVFLGAVTDAMLLGHWYLVQPGLSRAPLNQLVVCVAGVWPFEVAALLWPRGMASVLAGTVDDGWHGTLGWFWVACAITTIALALLTRAALRERQYSAVMAATGLLYLAILTASGTDLVARAVLAR